MVEKVFVLHSPVRFSTHIKTGAWKTAVEQTRGQILVNDSGALVSTQYAAVHGGWVNNVGWDTRSGGGSNWFNDAWEKISGVSWFTNRGIGLGILQIHKERTVVILLSYR